MAEAARVASHTPNADNAKPATLAGVSDSPNHARPNIAVTGGIRKNSEATADAAPCRISTNSSVNPPTELTSTSHASGPADAGDTACMSEPSCRAKGNSARVAAAFWMASPILGSRCEA